MVCGGWQSAWDKRHTDLPPHEVSGVCSCLFPNKTKNALALLKTILGSWSGSLWLLLCHAA